MQSWELRRADPGSKTVSFYNNTVTDVYTQTRWTWWDSSGGFWDTRLRVNKEGKYDSPNPRDSGEPDAFFINGRVYVQHVVRHVVLRYFYSYDMARKKKQKKKTIGYVSVTVNTTVVNNIIFDFRDMCHAKLA